MKPQTKNVGVTKRVAARDEIAGEIARRWPGANSRGDADKIMLAHAIGGTWDGWSPSEETGRLDDIRRHIEAAQALWRAMHPTAQIVVRQEASARKVSVALLDSDISGVVGEARRDLRGGIAPGRTEMLPVGLVEECRKIWARRTGRWPMSENGRPFAAFVQFVLDHLGVEASARATIRAFFRLYPPAPQQRRN